MAWLVLSLPDGQMHLVFLDTPGGGALVTAPDGARLLVDTGRSAAGLGAALDAQVPPGEPGVDSVLLTGSELGAAGGLAGLGPRAPALFMFPADTPGEVPTLVADALSRSGTRQQALVPGDQVSWHGLELQFDSCGPGLALTLRYGATNAWICISATRGDEGVLPPVALSAVDVGDGGADPDGATPGGWVVQHAARATSGTLAPATLGPRLWRTPRDGPLILTCNRQECWR
jgi:hypothetical protein